MAWFAVLVGKCALGQRKELDHIDALNFLLKILVKGYIVLSRVGIAMTGDFFFNSGHEVVVSVEELRVLEDLLATLVKILKFIFVLTEVFDQRLILIIVHFQHHFGICEL